MANLIDYMPQGVDAFKLQILREKLTENNITIPRPDKITCEERANLQITIRDIVHLSLGQCNNYLKALQTDIHHPKK